MKAMLILLSCLITRAVAADWDDRLDRLGDSLHRASASGMARAHLRGTLDLEGYFYENPAPGLVHSASNPLFNPRLTTYLDLQLGPRLYAFAQARIDHGFDPGDGHLEGRLDEYVIRFTPGACARFSVQAGKFATVIGNWVARHDSWNNPFVNGPLPYENPLGVFDAKIADSIATLQRWSHPAAASPCTAGNFEAYRIPIVWGPAYTNGAAVRGVIGSLDYAVEWKNTAPSARPERWHRIDFEDPAFAGRIGWRPNPSWYLGASASAGSYLDPAARSLLPPTRHPSEYREVVWAQDAAFAWRHFQLWAESYSARFAVPGVGRATVRSYYVEAKYKLTPRFSAALRWNEQRQARVRDVTGRIFPWSDGVQRVDAATSYRLNAHLALKLQYSVQSGVIGPRPHSQAMMSQMTLRF
jgi:hypothetical protein